MTDNEIIKALECCTIREMDCKNCLNKNQGLHCIYETMKLALDLINRQKAENESLKVDLAKCSIRLDNLYKTADEIKSKAIKEFWNKVKEQSYRSQFSLAGYYIIDVTDGNNLVKEMVEVEE